MSESEGRLFGDHDGPREFARQAFLTGAAVTLPAVVTLFVLSVVVEFVSKQLNPVVAVLGTLFGTQPTSEVGLKLFSVVLILVAIFGIGVWAERRPGRSGVGVFVDTLVSRIPGIGSLYRSIDEMSGLLLDSDTDSFQEVKLVEFPTEGSYSVAFLTSETPEVIGEATGHDEGMQTVFVPLAPNPVMGGYVLHVAADRVYDVEMTVEEGIQSIVTSGVATGQREEELTEGMLERVNRRFDRSDVIVGLDELEDYAADASDELEDRVQAARAKARSDGDVSREGEDSGKS
ncbi:DUF502 domain-containing protein [Halonotius terrestris]|uniref:DUF502 domain-containing protein n=1 Tax=Halonotius terrestris TaxID=2487750 RepID=A0A8J8PAZ9_9EURY|nr:DUF502 domain-containing protein [Halonotius terrestris]TQQ79766.1 DUF502 domain-containing protein [Halonotius terrestris]